MQEICCASVVLINYLPDFIRTELRCHTMCAAMKWKWLKGKLDKYQDFYLNICIHYFMPILADASANVSGLSLCLYYLSFHICYPYAIWLSLYLSGQYFLEAIASLGVNSKSMFLHTLFFKVMALSFQSYFFLTYSLLPPRVCIDKMWKLFENMLRQCAQLSVLRW